MRDVMLYRGRQGGEDHRREERGKRGVVVLHQVERDEEELVAEAHCEEDRLWVEGRVNSRSG